MSSGSLERPVPTERAPLLLTGSGTEVRETLAGEILERLPKGAIEAVAPDAVETVDADEVTAVICVCPADGDRNGAHSGFDLSALVGAVRDRWVDCPVIVVGEGIDAASAYTNGATDVVPIAVTDHAGAVAEQVATIVDRARGSGFARDLLDEIGDGITVHDPETGEILAANDRFYGMLGYDPDTDEISLGDVVGHDEEFTEERAVSLVREAAAGSPQTFEWHDSAAEGDGIWVEVKLEPARLSGEEYVVGTTREIDARKDRERDLEESRAQLTRLHGITADPELSFEEQVAKLLEFGTDVLDVQIAFLARIETDDDHFEVVDARGDHPLIQAGEESALGETYCRRVVAEGIDAPLGIQDAAREGMADDPAYEKFGLGCYLGAEIEVDGELYGTLCFADEEPRTRPFSGIERTLVDHMGQWLSQQLETEAYVEAVEDTRNRLEQLVERIDDAFFAVDEDWRVRHVNDAGGDVLRGAMDASYSNDELRGRHLWEEIPEAVETAFYEQYHRAMRDQESVTFEERYEPLDAWFEVRAYPDADGLSVYFTDVTERKERERELRIAKRALDEASMPLTMADPSREDNPLVYVNDAFEEVTGYTREAALGSNCRFLQGERTDPETVDELRDGIDAEETVSVEIRNYRADGTEFWNRLEVTPIYDEDGTLLRYFGSQTDVTEQRRSREVRRELLSTTERLMEASSREAVARIVSEAAVDILDHEVNAVYLRGDGSQLEAVAWSEAVSELFDRPLEPAADGPIRETLRRGEPVVVNDLGDASDRHAPVESLLLVPLSDHGVLGVGATEPDAFGDAEVRRAQLLTVNAASALDRTDRRRELEEYETVLETVRDELYVLDGDGYVEMVTDALAESLGYDREELEGAHASVMADEATRREGERRILDLLVTPEAVSNTFEGTFVEKDGTEMPVEIELSLLPHGDSFRGTVGTVRDISERRRREEELDVLQRAVTEAGIGLVMYGADGLFEYVNDHYARVLGSSRAALEGSAVAEAFDGVDRGSFDQYWETFDTGETRTAETEHRRVDGSTVPVETVTTAVDIDGDRRHVVTVREITGRREQRQQSEVLHRIMRHNLRNTVTVILAHAESLAERLAEGDGAGGIGSPETIVEMAERLVQLTETASDAEDIIGRDTVRRPVEITETVRDLAGEVEAEYGVAVETDLPERRAVLADVPLRTALSHALRNAVEHNDSPEPRVRVTLSEAPDRSGWVCLDIADNGPGIPETEREVLTRGTETQLVHGSGIGLWIIHWVVTRYGGELSFEEREDGGSVVRLSLPAADRAGDRPDEERDGQTKAGVDDRAEDATAGADEADGVDAERP
jgi:PAS domain S-box-containing protein